MVLRRTVAGCWSVVASTARRLLSWGWVLVLASPGMFPAVEAAPAPQTHTALSILGERIANGSCPFKSRTVVRRVASRTEPGAFDEIEAEHCGSMQILRFRAGSQHPPLVLLDSLILARSHRLLPRQLRMGASVKEVVRFTGEPAAKSADRLVYHLNDEGPGIGTATFAFRGGRLRSITWTWFIE